MNEDFNKGGEIVAIPNAIYFTVTINLIQQVFLDPRYVQQRS